jgi:DNA-3-methyladenine glycosylase
LTLDPRTTDFYARSVHAVARDLVGCVVRHGETSGRIVEVESYHQDEPACHAFAGLTPRTEVLFGAPGVAYVYRSYGIHALLNAVSEAEGTGAAVLIRALEPLDGIGLMHERRGVASERLLCSGPGKLTQALGIWLDFNGTPLTGGGPIDVLPRAGHMPEIVTGVRVGITKAADLPWRFVDATRAEYVSRPLPAALTRPRRAAAA